jgi:hypothetical protein
LSFFSHSDVGSAGLAGVPQSDLAAHPYDPLTDFSTKLKLPTDRSARSFTGSRRASVETQSARLLPTGRPCASVIAGVIRGAVRLPTPS